MSPFGLMRPDERLAFGGLLRLMVRMDGEFSKEEVVVVTELASELRAPDLWQLLNESSLIERVDLVEHVDAVRPELRRWIYGILKRIAEADGIDESEQDLLDWLCSRWEL